MDEPLDLLTTALRGALIRPGEPEYDAARSLWNGLANGRPAAIARCSGVADVITAVNFARDHDLHITVKAGGHGVAGSAVRDGSLVVDLSGLRNVCIDPVRRLAQVSAGAKLGDLDHEAQAFGLATTAGVDSRTGVSGLTLGGGIGFLARRFGLTIDNLVSVDVVLPDGSFRHATESEDADLLWAARGGRGVGVITAFELALHPVGPQVLAAQAFHPLSNAADVLRYYRGLMAEAPDALTCYAMFMNVPPDPAIDPTHHGLPALALVACYSAQPDEGRRWMEDIAGHGEPLSAGVQSVPYAALQSSFDAGTPEGARYYWKSHYLHEISDAAIETLVQAAHDLPGPYSIIGVEPLGGAVARTAVTATAFPHRNAQFCVGLWAGWENPGDDAAAIGWAREVHQALAPEATGGVYSNYLDRDDDQRQRAAYGDNFQRLRQIRDRFDPHGLIG